jgi:LysM repeat protein
MRDRLTTLWTLMACAALLASCAGQQPKQDNVPSGKPAQEKLPPTPPSVPPTPPPREPLPREAATPLNPQLAQRTAVAAVEQLESGHEAEAAAEVQRALAADPGNKLALSLKRQMEEPSSLPREHFPYTVRKDDSLSSIAKRFMGDPYLFWTLARYNDLKVPKQLQQGQVIRVPGKAPPPEPKPEPRPQPEPKAQPAPQPPPEPKPQPEPKPPPQPAKPPVDTAEQTKAKINAATKAAKDASARRDLDGEIKNWDIVLALDPGNAIAKSERERAIRRKKILDEIPSSKK